MRPIMAVMLTVGVLGVVAASVPARADEDDHEGGWRRHEHEWRKQGGHEWREHQWRAYAQPPAVYAPPGYYAPPPYYVPPPPAYYAAPPAYYAPPPPPPVYVAPGISLGFGFR